jgi:hypothetical protein
MLTLSTATRRLACQPSPPGFQAALRTAPASSLIALPFARLAPRVSCTSPLPTRTGRLWMVCSPQHLCHSAWQRWLCPGLESHRAHRNTFATCCGKHWLRPGLPSVSPGTHPRSQSVPAAGRSTCSTYRSRFASCRAALRRCISSIPIRTLACG